MSPWKWSSAVDNDHNKTHVNCNNFSRRTSCHWFPNSRCPGPRLPFLSPKLQQVFRVYHSHTVSYHTDGKPVLGPESSSGRFTIGGTISLNSASGSKLYLNVDTSVSTSYKPLSFGSTATTTNWGLEGDTIITTNPRQLNFIACSTSSSTIYDLYLQTGNQTPSGASCSLQTIHLPCLC